MRRKLRIHTVTALILCASVTAPSAASDSEPPALVVYTTSSAAGDLPPLTGDGEATLASLLEDPNVSMLRIGRSALDAVLKATSFSLASSPAPGYTVHFHDVERTDHPNGMVSLYAQDRTAGSETAIVIDGLDVSGRVHDGQGNTWRLTPLGGGATAVYQYDASGFRMHPPGWGPGDVPGMDTAPREHFPEGTPKKKTAEADTGDVIDVMVIYTRAARTKVGNIDSFLQEAFNNAHRHYENSEIPFRLRLVHAQETNYIQSGDIGDDLDAIRGTNDGNMDDVHALRDQHGADLVHLFIQGATSAGDNLITCGVANFANLQSDAHLGFGTTAVECEQQHGRTFVHEVGHNQGAHHDRPNVRDYVPFPYGYGNCHSLNRWSTVMAYVGIKNNCESRIPYFSSPSLRYGGVPTGVANSMDNRRVLLETARIVANHRQSRSTGGGTHHLLPYFLSRRTPGRQGFVRIVNRSDRAGTITVTAIDDAGRNAGTETLDLDARGALHFNSDDLEQGNRDKGLSGVGAGTEHWRLLVSSELDIQPLGYVRTDDGFVTRMDDVEEKLEGAGNRYIVHFTNPGSNVSQRSYLRLINAGSTSANITIRAYDDRGVQRGPVSLSLPAGRVRHVTASDLETGRGLSDGLGTGAGKWRLSVSATQPVHVMSLLDTISGHITNLSGVPGITGTGPTTPTPTDDHGDTPAKATVVQAPSSTPGSLESGGDKDYFRFDLRQGGRLQVQTTGSTDTFGTLLRGSSVIDSDNDGGSTANFRITVPNAQAGTWYVEVKGYDSTTTGAYTAQVEFTGTSSGSNIELSITDACNDGENIQFRFFGFLSRRPVEVWPSGGLVYVTRGLNQKHTSQLSCTSGRLVCYGGESRDTQRYYWGAGIDGDEGCRSCCVTCRSNVSQSWRLTCGLSDSVPLPSAGPAGEAPESVSIRR